MGFFGMLFWLLVIWMVIRAWHRRSERCLAIGPDGYTRGWSHRDRYRDSEVAMRTRTDSGRQEYIDALETRLTELEERLDFTERLLASRGDK
ncbi:MAG TPA: hypothetical protein VD930_11060 [Gemmatimonadales bacterium]|nr:hypothetical protein [Gemmatimonadales bacterium]